MLLLYIFMIQHWLITLAIQVIQISQDLARMLPYKVTAYVCV